MPLAGAHSLDHYDVYSDILQVKFLSTLSLPLGIGNSANTEQGIIWNHHKSLFFLGSSIIIIL